jgi:hypothetical protein
MGCGPRRARDGQHIVEGHGRRRGRRIARGLPLARLQRQALGRAHRVARPARRNGSPALVCAKRPPCSRAAHCAGPRPRRSRWATSSGGTARTRRGHACQRGGVSGAAKGSRAGTVVGKCGRLPRSAHPHPPAGGRGDGRRTTGVGRRHRPPASGCAKSPAMLLGLVRRRGAHDGPHRAAGWQAVRRGRGTARRRGRRIARGARQPQLPPSNFSPAIKRRRAKLEAGVRC